MCGIIGIFGKNNTHEKAHLSLEKIIHRGSNVFELEYFDGGVLGANRLPIVDRENGRQPKSNEDRTIFAVLNGEIFNYKKLKKNLSALGHIFVTDSDTEVLAHLYEEYGVGMVRLIDSEMFAFVIYDKKKNSIFAARDPLGVKPLYYAHDATGQIYFTSELKQLAFFDDIKEIKNFPPGSYFFDGKFKKYFNLKISNALNDENKIIRILEEKIVDAVAKRVDTDLPIGVLLSGGVDSSLIMEIAVRLHPDVTAIVLGYPGSSDYEFAMKLCKERKYKYHVIRPDIDFEEELDNIIFHLETYEPNIIHQSFSLEICAREAQRLGLRILLVGDGSDELFGGYNEFSMLPDKTINEGCLMLTKSMGSGHLQRLDRLTMKHTIEARAPFFDSNILDIAFKIDGKLKVKRENHQIVTKYILRKLAANFLPDYIAYRYKAPFSNGAGMNVGNNYKAQDGDVAKAALNKPKPALENGLAERYSLTTEIEKYYFSKYLEYGFTKLAGAEKRLIVKDNLNTLHKSNKKRLLVAEFDRLAIYFPAYFAEEKGFFGLHNLDIDFIATGGDDRTYDSLVNNSAHIGLSDPMFAMFENKTGVKGEIIGELVKSVPNVAVSIDPKIKINNINDFIKYKVGTFQEYSTTNNIAKFILPKETLILPLDYQELIDKLVNRTIDIAIVLPEQALDFEALGGKIIYNFQNDLPKYLFSGFTIANVLDPIYRKNAGSFVISVREAIRYIVKNKEESLGVFKKYFPNLKKPRETFEKYLELWSTTIKVEQEDYQNAHRTWKENYPELLKNYTPYFRKASSSDPIIEKFNSRNFRRDYPFLEDKLEEKIVISTKENKPLKLVGFWGAGNKSKVKKDDLDTIGYYKKYLENIKTVFQGKIEVTWILADEHAKNNGYDKKSYDKYLFEIKNILTKNKFKVVYLSDLWKSWKINHKMIDEVAKQKTINWWNGINIAKQLEEQAKGRYKKEDYLKGAKKYYIMRKLEKRFMEKDFRNSIFFAFSDGQMQSIYPKLPTLYLYTINRGVSEVPWFENQKYEKFF